ncbi:hypothetical protein M7I_7205 [Glarea lozoyensis 74030]|uniref:Uncharacterized protein n=1 Tax=Glarea lozoyensis (strain ATCC 74030 / MF5533) TaxID=1104152 RepID=H0EWN3_GLAL7|nr:hypothetical protein M7I_7205 [Glarea lozoyensis 74030]
MSSAKASEIQDQNQATMNVTLDGWMNQKIDDIQLYISRVTAHLFGHALGLPHPSIKFSSPWNFTELENHCGSFFATVVMSSNGYPGLLNPLSIMAFDRPGILGSGVNEHHGGLIVDSEALDLLRRLYPAYNIFCPSIGVVNVLSARDPEGVMSFAEEDPRILTGSVESAELRGDSTAYNIRATWLAHEQDQYDIRSGTFETPHHGLIHTREDKLRVGYTSPMRKKPSKMFAAFTYIDVETKTNIRLETRIEGWNERSAEGWFSTWEREKVI